ncbi:MAG: hypothetical protein ACYDCN_05600 [Bacteroidia bacterium]
MTVLLCTQTREKALAITAPNRQGGGQLNKKHFVSHNDNEDCFASLAMTSEIAALRSQ